MPRHAGEIPGPLHSSRAVAIERRLHQIENSPADGGAVVEPQIAIRIDGDGLAFAIAPPGYATPAVKVRAAQCSPNFDDAQARKKIGGIHHPRDLFALHWENGGHHTAPSTSITTTTDPPVWVPAGFSFWGTVS